MERYLPGWETSVLCDPIWYENSRSSDRWGMLAKCYTPVYFILTLIGRGLCGKKRPINWRTSMYSTQLVRGGSKRVPGGPSQKSVPPPKWIFLWMCLIKPLKCKNSDYNVVKYRIFVHMTDKFFSDDQNPFRDMGVATGGISVYIPPNQST